MVGILIAWDSRSISSWCLQCIVIGDLQEQQHCVVLLTLADWLFLIQQHTLQSRGSSSRPCFSLNQSCERTITHVLNLVPVLCFKLYRTIVAGPRGDSGEAVAPSCKPGREKTGAREEEREQSTVAFSLLDQPAKQIKLKLASVIKVRLCMLEACYFRMCCPSGFLASGAVFLTALNLPVRRND